MKFISAGIFMFTALETVLGMAYFTNKKVKFERMIKKSRITEKCLYHRGSAQLTLLLGILVISGMCGYQIGEHSGSILTSLKIGCCYIAALAAAVTDCKLKIIPNFISLSLIGLRLMFFVYEWMFLDNAIVLFLNSLIGGVGTFLFLETANKLFGGGIGAGDVKLLAVIGFMVDISIVVKIMVPALFLCAAFSLIMLALKKQTLKNDLPFAPFIYAGVVEMCLSVLWLF